MLIGIFWLAAFIVNVLNVLACVYEIVDDYMEEHCLGDWRDD